MAAVPAPTRPGPPVSPRTSAPVWLLVVLLAAVPVAVPGAAYAAPPQPCNLPATQVMTAEPWAQKRLAFQRVWPLTRGAGVTVGVVDTGVDARHPMLAGAVDAGIDVVNR